LPERKLTPVFRQSRRRLADERRRYLHEGNAAKVRRRRESHEVGQGTAADADEHVVARQFELRDLLEKTFEHVE